MKKAFDKMKQWQRDLDELQKKYIEFTEDYYKKLKKWKLNYHDKKTINSHS